VLRHDADELFNLLEIEDDRLGSLFEELQMPLTSPDFN